MMRWDSENTALLLRLRDEENKSFAQCAAEIECTSGAARQRYLIIKKEMSREAAAIAANSPPKDPPPAEPCHAPAQLIALEVAIQEGLQRQGIEIIRKSANYLAGQLAIRGLLDGQAVIIKAAFDSQEEGLK